MSWRKTITYLHSVRHQDNEDELGNPIDRGIHGYDAVTPFLGLLQMFSVLERGRTHCERLSSFWFLHHAAGRAEVAVWLGRCGETRLDGFSNEIGSQDW